MAPSPGASEPSASGHQAASARPVSFTVWSDFLCPWCYVAALRLADVKREAGAALRVEWRSFLLRPSAEPRPLDRFRQYTTSWLRPAEAEPSAEFHVWDTDTPPPSHSRPPAIAGKAAASFGPDTFDRFHLALMRAYFVDNRTVSERAVILDVAAAVELDTDEFAARLDAHGDEYEAAVVDDHKAALAQGIAAVPTVLVETEGAIDGEHVLSGAMTTEQYLKVVARLGS
ncbi:MAG: DsbA family protein [Actinomycetota bacterium]|nr:DsbA family protein [Actinomycetota bacterium]